MKRSGRGRGDRERVEAARWQAALALGRDPDDRHEGAEVPAPSPHVIEPRRESSTPPSSAIGVLTVGEAAMRLGMSRTELESMIDRGTVETLPTGFTRMIPTSEVERLQRAGA